MGLATEQDFDAVLMDVHMPIMNGLEATQALLEAGVGTPVYALTANADDATVKLCLDAGMRDILDKPISQRALKSFLHRLRREKARSSESLELSSEAPLELRHRTKAGH